MRSPGWIFSFSIVLLGLANCAHKSTGDEFSGVDAGPSRLAVGLHAFSDANGTLAYFKSATTQAMETQLEAQKRWLGYCMVDEAEPASGAAAPGAAAAAPSVPNHSTTNNQVAGVDEADILKTFSVGGALYTAYTAQPLWSTGANSYNPNGKLVISQVYPVANAAVTGELLIPGFPTAMLVAYPYAAVFTQTYTSYVNNSNFYDARDSLNVVIVDMTDVAHPAIVRQRSMQGDYLAARLVGQSVRVVTRFSQGGPSLSYYPSFDPNLNLCNPNDAERAAIGRAYDALIAQNKATIANAKLTDWLPTIQDGAQTTALSSGVLLRPGDPAGTDITDVTTLSLGSAATVSAAWDDVAVIAEGDTVYASPTSLYIATNPYDADYWSQFDTLWTNAQNGNNDYTWVSYPVEQTSVHRFDTSDPLHVTYFSSAVVQGSLANQFAMDEQNSLLRVASTTRRYAVLEQTDKSNNLVTVLDIQHDGMPQVGLLTNLEVGEHITAVRFCGPQVFMSTMHEVDPFLVVDLSNPAQPTLRGTLPVPGDATYLQSLDANHVLAIGYGAQQSSYWIDGVQLSIYDVSVPGAPRLTQNTTLQGEWVYSPALYDHLALTYFTTSVNGVPTNLLAFPVLVYGDSTICTGFDCYSDGLRVYKVDEDNGFTAMGDVYHNNLATMSTWGNESVQRSMIMGPTDDGKTYVVSASDLGEKVTDLSAFTGAAGGVTSVCTLPY